MSVKKPIPNDPASKRSKGFEREVGKVGYGALKKELARKRQEEAERAAREAKAERRATSQTNSRKD